MPTKVIDQSWIRIPGTYAGKERDRGELIPRFVMKNEERLLRLEYIKPWEPTTGWQPTTCPECGGEFIAHQYFQDHYERRHVERVERLPVREDRESERDYAERVAAWKEVQDNAAQRKAERELLAAPPNLEKSVATQRGV